MYYWITMGKNRRLNQNCCGCWRWSFCRCKTSCRSQKGEQTLLRRFERILHRSDRNASWKFYRTSFLKTFPGYLWIFPMPGGIANVGVGMLSESVAKKKNQSQNRTSKSSSIQSGIEKSISNARTNQRTERLGTALGSRKENCLAIIFFARWWCRFTHWSLYGEGIGNALTSGMVAAGQNKSNSLDTNQFDAKSMSAYDSNIYSVLWDELKLSHNAKTDKLLMAFNFVVNKASKSKTLRDTITCMFEDLDMRDKLRSPGFYFKLLWTDKCDMKKFIFLLYDHVLFSKILDAQILKRKINQYKNGRQEGLWIMYSDSANQNKESRGHYVNGKKKKENGNIIWEW